MQANTLHDDFARLSNDDIQIVHAIVEAASRINPNSPYTKTLFDAWQLYIDDKKISTSDGNRYFTVIARMARPGNATGVKSMFELFQKTMSEGGIIVDFDADEGENDTDEINPDDLEHELSAEVPLVRSISRRASFTSVYDTLHEDIDRNLDEPPPAYSALALRQKRSTSRVTDPGSRRLSTHSEGRRSELPIRGRPNGRNASEQIPRKSKRSPSNSSNGSLRIRRAASGSLDGNGIADDSSAYGSDSEQFALSEEADLNQNAVFTVNPSDTQMLADADTFLTHRVRVAARNALHSWHDQMLRLHERKQVMKSVSLHYDRNILMRSAFSVWFEQWQAKRAVRHTEQYWAQRERLATRLRDEHLIYKAFSHWAQHATDQIIRTSVARRHILRTRYFNAWRDITAVNQLKIRQHGLQKYFNIWKTRSTRINVEQHSALTASDHHLLRKSLWTWQQRTVEEQVSREHKAFRLQERQRPILEKWADIVRSLRTREVSVQQIRSDRAKLDALALWLGKTRHCQSLNSQAVDFRRRMLLTTVLRSLKTQSSLQPLKGQLTNKISSRITRNAIKTLVSRSAQSTLARQVERQIIIRRAFTAWNDQLRILALSVQIDSRLRRELFTTWRLNERYSHLVKQQDEKLKLLMLSRWSTSSKIKRTARETAEHVFQSYQREHGLRSALSRLRGRLLQLHDQQDTALSLQAPRLKAQSLAKLASRAAVLHQLDLQADAARFYVLANHVIKAWRGATSEHQRGRRRQAYAVVRRNYKIGLVSRCFGNWREKSLLIQEQTQTAQSMAEDRLLTVLQLSLKRLNHIAQRTQSQAEQATDMMRTRLLQLGWQAVVTRHALNNSMQVQASLLRDEISQVQKDACMRRLNWRLFELQRLEHSGASLEQRNFKKHVRNMIRYWAEMTAGRRLERSRPPRNDRSEEDHPGEPPPNGRGRVGSSRGDGTAEYHTPEEQTPSRRKQTPFPRSAYTPRSEWRAALDASAFDIRPLDLNFDVTQPLPTTSHPQTQPTQSLFPAEATPLPGYLRTPSKRSTARRVRDLAGTSALLESTTPLGPPPSSLRPEQAEEASSTFFPSEAVAPDQQKNTAPPTTLETPARAISSFETRLKALGYSAPRRGIARFARQSGTPRTGGRGMGRGGKSVGFVDIGREENDVD